MAKGRANRNSKLTRVDEDGGDDITDSQIRIASVRGIDHYAIALRAREIWEREGCPEGKEVEHWLQAERELMNKEVSDIE